MKKVLITGANSYVGRNVEKWLLKEPNNYCVDTLDMKDQNWKNYDFSGYDVVFHVAGIAHVSNKKSLANLYYRVNRDLAIQTASKAKESGVKHFIFMSSMIIYGEDNIISNKSHVDINKYNPINAYGDSKLQADLEIQKLRTSGFTVSIIRTPIIYGPNCKGNFPKLQKIAKYLFVVPSLLNQKSMIYIDNFAEFVKQLINFVPNGVFYPQNEEYMSTVKIIKTIRQLRIKRTFEISIFNPLLKFLSRFIGLIRKIFGNKTYDLSISKYDDFNYNIVGIEESIQKSIGL